MVRAGLGAVTVLALLLKNAGFVVSFNGADNPNVRCKFSPCLTPRELQTLLLRAGFGAKIMRKNLIERTEDLPFRRTE